MKRVADRTEQHLIDAMDGRVRLSRHERISFRDDFHNYIEEKKEETHRVVVSEFNKWHLQAPSLDANCEWVIGASSSPTDQEAEA